MKTKLNFQLATKKSVILAITFLARSTQVLAQEKPQQNKKNMATTTPAKTGDFPLGEENTAYAQYFTGKSWNAPLTSNKDLKVPINNISQNVKRRNSIWRIRSN